MTTLNWRYGCGRPDNWADSVDDQLRGQTALWNRLVEIEAGARAKYRDLMAEDSAIAAIEARIAEMSDQIEAMKTERAARRQAARKKAVDTTDLPITETAAVVKVLRAEAKDLRTVARERMAEPLRALEMDRRKAVADARRESAANGLWWGNYNAVIAAFDGARAKAMKTGRPVQPRHYDGTGRLTVQIQGGMTPEELFTSERSEVEVIERPRSDGKPTRWQTLRLTAWSRPGERYLLSIPILIHRPFPPGCRIKAATLTRRRTAPGHIEHAAVFTVAIDEEIPQRLPARRAAIDIGYRVTTAGLRVAVLTDDAGGIEHVTLPPQILRRMDLCERIQSEIDDALNTAWPRFTGRDWSEAPEAMAEVIESLRRARRPHPRHLVRLRAAWSEDWQAEEREELDAMLREDLRERRRLAQTRARALGHRKDWMRKTVAGWLRRYGEIVVDGHDLRIVRESHGEESPLPDIVRRNQRLAAPGELRAWLIDAGKRAGVKITIHKGKSTWACHSCGTEHKPVHADDLIHRCRHCGSVWDQDENAARNMLAA